MQSDGAQQSLLAKAILAKDVNAVGKAIADGANLEERDKNGTTALHVAAAVGDLECAWLLVDAKANLASRDSSGSKRDTNQKKTT